MMHPFFRYGLGSSSQSGQSKKDGTSRTKSPTGSYEEEGDDEEVIEGRRISVSPSLQQRLLNKAADIAIPVPAKRVSVPVIKVEDQVVFSGKGSSKSCSNDNRKRLGPNKNNIIFETLQNDLKGAK